MTDDLSPNPVNQRTMAQKAWLVYYILAVPVAIYCIYFTNWGGRVYAGLSYVLLIYGFFASMYVLIKLLVMRYRARHPHAARPEPHPLAPSPAAFEVAPAAKTSFFHDDPSRAGHSGIGMPALWNFGAARTIAITVFLAAAACLVHYLSAQPSRQQALTTTGFLCAVGFYLWLLMRYAIHAFRWMKRHLHHSPANGEVPSTAAL